MILMLSCGVCALASDSSQDYENELNLRKDYENTPGNPSKVNPFRDSLKVVGNVVYMKYEKFYAVVDFLGVDEDGNYVEKIVVPKKIDSLPVKWVIYLDHYYFEEHGFSNDSIKEIVLPDTIEYIGDYAFWRHTKARVTHIPNKINTIGSYSYLARNRKKIVLPATATEIAKDAFAESETLEKITFPKKVTTIPSGVLSYCKSLKKVTFKGKIKKIGTMAFDYCTNLQSITIPKTVKKIGKAAFKDCKNLKKITIPKNVEKINSVTFGGCKELSKVVFKGYECPKIDTFKPFKNTKKGIRFQVRTRAIAKELKAELKNSGVRKAKIYVGDKLIYKNITDDYWR